jgi:hypothetical protein
MAGNGPLPDPKRRRTNAPTIPTTALPARGRPGRPPAVPSWVRLAKSGRAWWAFAWKTPQAAAWSVGDVPLVARRASLEDDLATIGRVDSLDALDLAGQLDPIVKLIVGRLAALVTGKLAIIREMREIDDRLGLTPKGMAALRWQIVDDQAADAAPTKTPANVTQIDRRARLAENAS